MHGRFAITFIYLNTLYQFSESIFNQTKSYFFISQKLYSDYQWQLITSSVLTNCPPTVVKINEQQHVHWPMDDHEHHRLQHEVVCKPWACFLLILVLFCSIVINLLMSQTSPSQTYWNLPYFQTSPSCNNHTYSL